MAEALMEKLDQEESSANYEEELEKFIDHLAYLGLLAIYLHFNSATQRIWCDLTTHLQGFFQKRADMGGFSMKSSPYIGKLLGITLICMFNMRDQLTLEDAARAEMLLTIILRASDAYVTTLEKYAVSSTLIKMLSARSHIPEHDEECLKSFEITSQLLYSSFGRDLKAMDMELEAENPDSSDINESDDDDVNDKLNYLDYTMKDN